MSILICIDQVNALATGWSSVGSNAVKLLAVSRGMLVVLTLYFRKIILSCFWFQRLSSV
jgi:hypothetical protein